MAAVEQLRRAFNEVRLACSTSASSAFFSTCSSCCTTEITLQVKGRADTCGNSFQPHRQLLRIIHKNVSATAVTGVADSQHNHARQAYLS